MNELDLVINPEYTMLKKLDNGLYLSQEQIDILEEYNIDYKSCKSLSELIMKIDMMNNDSDVLENLLDILSERNYYEYYNK